MIRRQTATELLKYVFDIYYWLTYKQNQIQTCLPSGNIIFVQHHKTFMSLQESCHAKNAAHDFQRSKVHDNTANPTASLPLQSLHMSNMAARRQFLP